MGLGGTGSLVAEGLPRLLLNIDIPVPVYLVDFDRVEPHNLRRQAFYEDDLGKFKSEVIARRLAQQYGRKIAYTVHPFDKEMEQSANSGGNLVSRLVDNCLVIGCVDGASGRIAIHEALENNYNVWWLDAGNSFNSGQVLIGNSLKEYQMIGTFVEQRGMVTHVPAPSYQSPALLMPEIQLESIDCAQEVERNEQSPVINQAMASLVLEYVYRIIIGKLSWVGSYIDLDAGTRSNIPAEPAVLSRMLSINEQSLMYQDSGKKYKVQRGLRPGDNEPVTMLLEDPAEEQIGEIAHQIRQEIEELW